ncbi:MAG: methionine--tRNA ligase [Deltaproteobacteria bacterium]|nr:methionine--tRNA ligase [Deltaproteobacteria bacterium]
MSKKYFYVTTPIYYVNDLPHIGHAYTTIAADVLARFKRMDGFETFFLTGTDEHGSKVEQTAQKNNEQPIELANRVVQRFQNLWKKLLITHDDFIRTTEERHKKVVTHMIKTVLDQGDIYLGNYEDWYCTPCETFWTKTQLDNKGRCPECHREVQKLKEESYFFKMSKYEAPLIDYINKNPHFIEPESRRNEILSFIKEGLRDLSISRTTVTWGVPMPQTDKTNFPHIVYIWFDALLNYVSGLGYFDNKDRFQKFWPEAIHLIGKDILRHHTIYWPTFLMALGLPLPKKIFAHGWWTHEGEKMSKSKGNFIEPEALIDEYGVDPLRYFVLREIPFGSDGDFSNSALIGRINSDLADDYGNLLNRTITMTLKYQEGKVLKPSSITPIDQELVEKYTSMRISYKKNMDDIAFHKALTALWEAIRFTNKYIDSNEPWKLSKDESKKERLNDVLGFTLEAIRIASVLISPFMPQTAGKALSALGIQGFSCGTAKEKGIDALCGFWENQKEFKVQKTDPLFKKYEISL